MMSFVWRKHSYTCTYEYRGTIQDSKIVYKKMVSRIASEENYPVTEKVEDLLFPANFFSNF
jgi:hypothetical protein